MDKYDKLKEIIRRYPSALVAFSGGVDSTFLAAVTAEVLGDNVLLVTADSQTYPASEKHAAEQIARQCLQRPHRLVATGEMSDPDFRANPPDRCYHCKHSLFTTLVAMARDEGYAAVFEGSNTDDVKDFRPGRRALSELGIISPLLEADLSKPEIRTLSAAMGLSTAAKPSYACLASRIPYGEEITGNKLRRIDCAEAALRSLGFTQLRVRSHNDLARLEFIPTEFDKAWSQRDELVRRVTKCGFTYVTIDLTGYRTGAMNEALPK